MENDRYVLLNSLHLRFAVRREQQARDDRRMHEQRNHHTARKAVHLPLNARRVATICASTAAAPASARRSGAAAPAARNGIQSSPTPMEVDGGVGPADRSLGHAAGTTGN